MRGSEQAAARRPVVGLTTYLERAKHGVWDAPAALLPHQYVESVTLAGGTALLLPTQPAEPADVAEVVGRVDALVLTGGKDVEARRYGAAPHPSADEPRPERDAWEVALVRSAVEQGVPVLGVCRGMQVLNVALGGTLHQHLPDLLGADDHRAGPGRFASNEVRTQPGTLVDRVFGGSAQVACYHHQAVDRVAPGLEVSARAADGTVEAVEQKGPGYVVGVQWHPEETREDIRLFGSLVEAGRG